jgi:hypothetical protein
MAHDVTDDLDRRLEAARPQAGYVDDTAFDADLLARVRSQPIQPRRAGPRVAAPIAVGVTITAAAGVMLVGGPGDVGGPSSAEAIAQTLRWLTPSRGTVLHVRSVETRDGYTVTREFWQSADHPESERLRIDRPQDYEVAGKRFYDPVTDTIYDDAPGSPKPDEPGGKKPAAKNELEQAVMDSAPVAGPDGEAITGDPIVFKVRTLLRAGHMSVNGREDHSGTSAWRISLKPGTGRKVWTLWVSANDGKPLELRDPGDGQQVIRWPVYELLRGSRASDTLSLTAAHPSARVVTDPDKVAAARERLTQFDGP